jgi:phosphate transport system protein
MNQLDKELNRLKETVIDMIDLVILQVERAQLSMFSFNDDILLEATSSEKTINNLDLKIDTKSENILALYHPVAIDLRFVLACLSFNVFLERVGDNAIAIVKIAKDTKGDFTQEQLKAWRLDEMFTTTLTMLDQIREGIEHDDTKIVASTFIADKVLKEINVQSEQSLVEYTTLHPEKIKATFALYSVFRKLERIGDLETNLAENLIFYIDAKVLKHKKKKIQKFIEKSE